MGRPIAKDVSNHPLQSHARLVQSRRKGTSTHPLRRLEIGAGATGWQEYLVGTVAELVRRGSYRAVDL